MMIINRMVLLQAEKECPLSSFASGVVSVDKLDCQFFKQTNKVLFTVLELVTDSCKNEQQDLILVHEEFDGMC